MSGLGYRNVRRSTQAKRNDSVVSGDGKSVAVVVEVLVIGSKARRESNQNSKVCP